MLNVENILLKNMMHTRFKAHFSKACHKYLVANPGQVITTDVIAALFSEAWPLSITPLNIMSRFKKCGIYPVILPYAVYTYQVVLSQ